MGRPQRRSVRHQLTLSLGHVLDDCLNIRLRHLHSTKSPPSSGCDPVSPLTRKILPSAKTFPARHCQQSAPSPRHPWSTQCSRQHPSRRQCPSATPLWHTIAAVGEFPPDVSTPVSLLPALSTRLSRHPRTRSP